MMATTADRWLRHARLWVPALVFLLVNLGLLAGYRVVLGVRVSSMQSDLEEQREVLADLVAERESLASSYEAAERNRADIEELRVDRFQTEAGRLTRTMLRVKQLARDAGLSGQETISYPEEEVQEYGLVKKSFVFGVAGSYRDLREFINLLELNESFLTLEEIRVSEEKGGRLKIQVRLSTLFVEEPMPTEASS